MKLLLGSGAGELNLRLLEGGSEPVQVQLAATREQFLFRLEEDYDKIAVDTALFSDVYPWDMIRELEQRLQGKDTPVILLPSEGVYDSLMLELLLRLALEAGFVVTPLIVSGTDLVFYLEEAVQGREAVIRKSERSEGIVAACWSAGSRDGASTVSLNLALALATHSPLKIGYLDLNLKNPSVGTYLNLAESAKSNIRIRPLLQTQALSPAGLLDACIGYRRVKRLFILPGTARRETASDVTPEMIDHLLTVARQTFDLTLLDLSGYPDNAATVCGVRGADIRLLTARPQFDSYRTGWGDWYDCYWKYCGLAPQEIALVMNRTTVPKDAINAADYLGMTLWGTLPDAPGGLGLRAVDEGQPLYYQPGAESFVAAIHDLAGRLAGETGAAFGFPERSKPRLWTRISALMG